MTFSHRRRGGGHLMCQVRLSCSSCCGRLLLRVWSTCWGKPTRGVVYHHERSWWRHVTFIGSARTTVVRKNLIKIDGKASSSVIVMHWTTEERFVNLLKWSLSLMAVNKSLFKSFKWLNQQILTMMLTCPSMDTHLQRLGLWCYIIHVSNVTSP